jgi:hypothetical protein
VKIIGITGKAGAGKDTSAAFILEWCEEQGLKALRWGFADLLKLSACRALGGSTTIPVEGAVKFCDELKQDEGRITITLPTEPLSPIREYQITGREFLQWYGTEAHRDTFDEQFWSNALWAHIDEHFPDVDVLVIPDTRFDNESRSVLSHEGEIWRVTRPGSGAGSHSSEADIDDSYVSLEIANVGDEADLRELVRLACEDKIERKGA